MALGVRKRTPLSQSPELRLSSVSTIQSNPEGHGPAKAVQRSSTTEEIVAALE
jgi:hypothetical protein